MENPFRDGGPAEKAMPCLSLVVSAILLAAGVKMHREGASLLRLTIRPPVRGGQAMNSRAWKWALISAPLVLSVSACMGWGGYPVAKNVHESQLIGTWRAEDCDTTLTLSRDGSASVTGMPTEMNLDGKVTQRVSEDGTWEIDKAGAEQELDLNIKDEWTSFDLYRGKGRLLVGLTVGDPDNMNWCALTRDS
ncbi:hypothetical protein [Streptomyces sp. NPDC052292]|uniref:hypothetical protein n=1 Tax=Streptomyces sp. NPDC052292 TaxID=3155053 RepID=UPI003447ECCE